MARDAAVQPTSPQRRQSSSLTSTLVSDRSASSSSTSSSASSSDGESSEDDGTDSEDDSDDDETTARLQALLLKAKESARAKDLAAKQKLKSGGDVLAGNDEVVRFDVDDNDDEDEDSDSDEEEGEDGSTPKASTSTSTIKSRKKPAYALPPSLVKPLHLRAPSAASLLTGSKSDVKGKARAGALTLGQDLSGIVEEEAGAKGDRWGRAPVPSLSKKERKAVSSLRSLSNNSERHADALHLRYEQRQVPTAGPKWFDMPATPLTPEIKREIQALRLRNALDPKRFYRGSAKEDKAMPEFFQIGHVIDERSGSVSTSNSTPIARKRTFVEELVEDEQARAYTKRKTKEVMERGMSGRRGGNRKGANKKRGKGRA